MKRASMILFALLLPAAVLPAGRTLRAQNADQNSSAGASISFTRVWDAFTPQSVTFTVSASGATKYSSNNPGKTGDDVDDFQTEFNMSPGARDKLFRYAKEAHYFNGDFSFKKHAVSSTGKKTLTYADQVKHFETSYDYSENKAIQEITNIFAGISNTIEQGRKLQFLRRFDKLGLEAELKGMETAFEGHNLEELQLIKPT